MAKAATDAEAKRQQRFASVQDEVTALHTKLEESWQKEQQDKKEAIQKKIQQEVFAIAGKTLADIAGVGLEAQIIPVFIQRIGTLNEEEEKKLKTAFISSGDAICIKSAFPLSEQQKSSIEKVIREKIDGSAAFRYETSP